MISLRINSNQDYYFRDENIKKKIFLMIFQILGTSSLRRKMQAKFLLGAEKIFSLNGNIDTRIRKLNSGKYDCIILATRSALDLVLILILTILIFLLQAHKA